MNHNLIDHKMKMNYKYLQEILNNKNCNIIQRLKKWHQYLVNKHKTEFKM